MVEFLNNVVILVKKDYLVWSLLNKSILGGEDEFILSSIGPDDETKLEVRFTNNRIHHLKVTNKNSHLFISNYPEQLSILKYLMDK